MSCAPKDATFRLLNHLVGWDEASLERLVGTDDGAGVRLAPLHVAGDVVPTESVAPWLSPANLAFDACLCRWYLVTPCPPRSRLLYNDPCSDCFEQPWPGAVDVFECATAVAVCGDRIAVADSSLDQVLLFTDGGRRQIGAVPFADAGPIACAPWQGWLAVDLAAGHIVQLDPAGGYVGVIPAPLPGHVNRMAVDDECRIWLAVDAPPLDGVPQVTLWVAERTDPEFEQASFDGLQSAFDSLPISIDTDEGFCLQLDLGCGPCFSWYGRPLPQPIQPSAAPVQYETQGQLLTFAIDSGIPRCRWHRVRVDADVPPNTTMSIAVSASENATPAAQGVASAGWLSFAAGLPHPDDWWEGADSGDYLVQQPAGRYLFVRLRLTGDGLRTPRVHQVRLDFPRQTSLNELPAVFRQTPEAEDFSERFLSLFDAYLDDVDELIERLPAILDVLGAPGELMPWLGSFLDIAMDPAWDLDRRRRLISAAPRLYRMRGTVDGMSAAIRLVFDVDPVIRERAVERPWGAVGAAPLSGGVRLFGPSHWRFLLDRSRLSRARIRSFGQPDLDPFNAVSYRFDVMVPLVLDATTFGRLEQLVNAQKPAHTVATVRDSNGRFTLGRSAAVGIDTVFRGFEPTVLGPDEGLSLGGSAVLSAARRSARGGIVAGPRSAVGINRHLE
jgi:phage tail-like protein